MYYGPPCSNLLICCSGSDVYKRKRKYLSLHCHKCAQGHVGVLKTLTDTVLNSSTQDVDNMMHTSLMRMLSVSTTPQQLLNKFLLQGCKGGLTPLMLAAQGGHAEAVGYLLNIGEERLVAIAAIAWGIPELQSPYSPLGRNSPHFLRCKSSHKSHPSHNKFVCAYSIVGSMCSEMPAFLAFIICLHTLSQRERLLAG